MAEALTRVRDPLLSAFDDAWVGLEPTFQSKKSIEKWEALTAGPAGEDEGADAYFCSRYMRGTIRHVAKTVVKRFQSVRKGGRASALFDSVERKEELDPWKITRQNLTFRFADPESRDFEVRVGLDPETFEFSIKPVPLAWFYERRFLAFLEEVVWPAPEKHGLTPSMGHGSAQFSLSAKTYLRGSLLADDIADRLNHPELTAFVLDWPNPDERGFRVTRARFDAFKDVLAEYWSGAFHPRAVGVPTARSALFGSGFEAAPDPHGELMDPARGPLGTDRDVFQTNFAFGRAVREFAQSVDPGYWQSAHPKQDGYRPDQIMRYSEANLNRLQIAGELHVKGGQVLDEDRVPELDSPLDLSMLATEASYEIRGQSGRTSVRDYVEALLLEVHRARWLEAHPHVRIVDSLLIDQLLADGEATVRKWAGPGALDALRSEARAANLEASGGRVRSDWIEPETLFWAAWKALPAAEQGAIAREVVQAFVQRVHEASAFDPRGQATDPMEWHRHRVHPMLWQRLEDKGSGDTVDRELAAWKAGRQRYLARRPVFSQAGVLPPWSPG